MNIQEWSKYIAGVILRKAVNHWARKHPKVLEMHTDTFVNNKRYLIHIHRTDFKDFEPTEAESKKIRKGVS